MPMVRQTEHAFLWVRTAGTSASMLGHIGDLAEVEENGDQVRPRRDPMHITV